MDIFCAKKICPEQLTQNEYPFNMHNISWLNGVDVMIRHYHRNDINQNTGLKTCRKIFGKIKNVRLP